MAELFSITFLGTSRDGRTNRWRSTCKKCNKSEDLPTTMFNYQGIECGKCENREVINYNNEIDEELQRRGEG